MSDEQTSLLAISVDVFLDRLAERTPAPGGGALAGLAGALSCALARMVAAYSPPKNAGQADQAKVEDIARRLARADKLLRTLVDEDARAYDHYTRVARAVRDSTASKEDLETATALTVAIPLKVCATAADAMAVCEELAPVAGRRIVPDLEVAAILAEAAVRCAACMVRVSAASVTDQEQVTDTLASVGQIEAAASERMQRVRTAVQTRFQA